jgi:hypothetical protein
MTPTLLGRWQTRLLLLGTVGLLITAGFALLYRDGVTPFVLLGYVILIGFGWDVLYDFLQTLHWDRDWPPIFFLGGAVIEAVVLWGLIRATFLWHMLGWITLPGVNPALTLGQFVAHYTTVWLVTFLLMLGPIRIAFLDWRFRGGQF